MTKPTKRKGVPVTERGVVQRINRKFQNDDHAPARMLKKTKGARAVIEFGFFYVLDPRRNLIVDHHVDPESLARELGCLADWEYLDIEGET